MPSPPRFLLRQRTVAGGRGDDNERGEVSSRDLRWIYLPCVFASRIARHRRSGVAGMSKMRVPQGASAALTALITPRSAPTVPASPAPLMPLGLGPVGGSVAATPQNGQGSARRQSEI